MSTTTQQETEATTDANGNNVVGQQYRTADEAQNAMKAEQQFKADQ